MYQRISENWATRPVFIREIIFCQFLILITIFIYWPIHVADFITFDDQLHITTNFHLKSGFSWESIIWAFTTSYGGNWHPLTWFSFMLDYRLFGLNPAGYHSTNLCLHALNGSILFLVLHRLTKSFWRSALVATLFVVHPCHVEAVAWISERKDLLCTFFGFAAMGAYVKYIKTAKSKYYLLLVVLFSLALMSKPMIITLPFILLLLDYWPLKRISAIEHRTKYGFFHAISPLIREKIPLLCLSTISAIVTYWAQQSWEAISSFQAVPLTFRLMNAVYAYIKYIENLFWPANLTVFYPTVDNFQEHEVLFYVLTLVIITCYAIYKKNNYPYLIVGWFIYLGTLIPVIGIVKIGSQSMADRYTYIPFIGLFIIISWGICNLFEKVSYRKIIVLPLVLIFLIYLSCISREQVKYWRNSVTLFSHALQIVPNNYVAHENLGFAFLDQGRLDDALYHFRKASVLMPGKERFYKNVSIPLHRQGRYEEAINELIKSLRINPNYSDGYYHLGNIYYSQQRLRESADQYRRTIALQPDHAEAHNNLGMILAQEGHTVEAIKHCSEAIRLKPDFAEAFNNMGVYLANQGDLRGAIAYFDKALTIKPDYLGALNNRETVLKRLK